MHEYYHLTQKSTVGPSPVSLWDIIYKEAAGSPDPGQLVSARVIIND